MSKRTNTYYLRLTVRGDDDIVDRAVESALDSGALQDAVADAIDDDVVVKSLVQLYALGQPTERLYIAIGGFGWAKGLSPDEAKRQAKRHAKPRTRFDVYELPEGAHSAYVGDLGDVHWRWMPGADTTAQARLIERAGKAVSA